MEGVRLEDPQRRGHDHAANDEFPLGQNTDEEPRVMVLVVDIPQVPQIPCAVFSSVPVFITASIVPDRKLEVV